MGAQRQWTGWLCEDGGCEKVQSPTRSVPCKSCCGYKAVGR